MRIGKQGGPPLKLAVAAVGVVAVATLVIHAAQYPPLTDDDAYISLRCAQRLLDGHGLTWTDGTPVEGYSNLLWVLGCAALAALGVELVSTPIVLGVASAVAILGAVVYAFPPRTWSGSLPAFAGSMYVALAGPIGLWAVAGLEACLVGALLAWSVVLVRPLLVGKSRRAAALRAGLLLGLLCLARPDAPIFVVVICAFLVLWHRTAASVIDALAIGLIPAVAVLGQLVFRLVYYRDWLPNTARAKVAVTGARWADGVACVADAGASAYALWLPAAFALYVAWSDPRRRPWILLLTSVAAVWTLYAAVVVCHPYGFRTLIPTFVLLSLLVAEVLDWVGQRDRIPEPLAWATTIVALVIFAWAQQSEDSILLAKKQRPPVTVMGMTIGRTLRGAFEDADPLLAVDAAGVIPFESGFRSLDMLGLNDAHIARRRDQAFGSGTQGHELGDGDYVLSREPDIIVAKRLGTSRLAFRGGREIENDPRFQDAYRSIRMHGDDPVPRTFYAFVRLEGAVGIERTAHRVVLPGFLFARHRDTRAELDAAGVFGARFDRVPEAILEGVELPEGRWHVDAVGTGQLSPSLRRSRADGSRHGAFGTELLLARPGRVDIRIIAEPRAFLTDLIVRRVDD